MVGLGAPRTLMIRRRGLGQSTPLSVFESVFGTALEAQMPPVLVGSASSYSSQAPAGTTPSPTTGAGVFDVGNPQWVQDASGNWVDCNAFISGLSNPVCWGGITSANTPGQTAGIDCSQLSNVLTTDCTLTQYLSANAVAVLLVGLAAAFGVLVLVKV
jgi:hypothetical protein